MKKRIITYVAALAASVLLVTACNGTSKGMALKNSTPTTDVDADNEKHPGEVTITFDLNGGSFSDGRSNILNVKKGRYWSALVTAGLIPDESVIINPQTRGTFEGFTKVRDDVNTKIPNDQRLPITDDITVYAYYPGITKRITFATSCPTKTDVTSEIYGEDYPLGAVPHYDETKGGGTPQAIQDPEHPGYTYQFAGWSPDIKPVTGEQQYVAQFIDTTPVHTVEFDFNDGLGGHAQIKVKNKDKIQSVDIPKPSISDGWTYKWMDSSGSEFDFNSEIVGYTSLKAEWSYTKPFIVYFIGNGAESPLPDPTQVQPGGTVGKPADPTREGYSFGGWYSDPGCSTGFDFGAEIWQDTFIYAKWDFQGEFVVHYFYNDSEWDTRTIRYGQKAPSLEPPAAPDPDGYLFSGWCQDPECTTKYSFDSPIYYETYLYGKHFAKALSLTFISEGIPYYSADNIAYGSKFEEIKPADPESTEHGAFQGWFDADGNAPDEFVTKNSTYFAVFQNTGITHFVQFYLGNFNETFDKYEGTIALNEGKYIVPKNEPKRPEEFDETSVFSGWCSDEACQVPFDFARAISGDDDANISIYGKFIYPVYEVRFVVPEGAPLADTQSIDFKTTTAGSRKPTNPSNLGWDPAWDGHQFYGWYQLGGDGVFAQYNFDGSEPDITGDFTLYASYDYVQYSVKFNIPEDPSFTPIETLVWYGEKVSPPEMEDIPVPENYYFDGWYQTPDFDPNWKFNFDTPITASGVELYGRYLPIELAIAFDSNGGSLVMPITALMDHTIPADQKPANPTKTGYQFDYWYFLDTDGVTEIPFYFEGDSGQPTVVTSEMILYAKWGNEIKHNVTFHWNDPEGGTTREDIVKSVREGAGVVPPYYDLERFNFVGWFDSPNDGEGNLIDFDTWIMQDFDYEVWAHWTSIPQTPVYESANVEGRDVTVYGPGGVIPVESQEYSYADGYCYTIQNKIHEHDFNPDYQLPDVNNTKQIEILLDGELAVLGEKGTTNPVEVEYKYTDTFNPDDPGKSYDQAQILWLWFKVRANIHIEVHPYGGLNQICLYNNTATEFTFELKNETTGAVVEQDKQCRFDYEGETTFSFYQVGSSHGPANVDMFEVYINGVRSAPEDGYYRIDNFNKTFGEGQITFIKDPKGEVTISLGSMNANIALVNSTGYGDFCIQNPQGGIGTAGTHLNFCYDDEGHAKFYMWDQSSVVPREYVKLNVYFDGDLGEENVDYTYAPREGYGDIEINLLKVAHNITIEVLPKDNVQSMTFYDVSTSTEFMINVGDKDPLQGITEGQTLIFEFDENNHPVFHIYETTGEGYAKHIHVFIDGHLAKEGEDYEDNYVGGDHSEAYITVHKKGNLTFVLYD